MTQGAPMQTRKTRFVCISDTHQQTPKLPKGDVLIHAGDLTNQGSYSELQKTVAWLERAEFEAKIVIAGNHEITLDAPFFEEHSSKWKWPEKQDLDKCRRLLTESASITYLENESAVVYLTSAAGPKTCFKVFGSPAAPNKRKWAFRYDGEEEARRLWDAIPGDADVVVTHTPPRGLCDATFQQEMSGCPYLLGALHRVRPLLSVCGHIHAARGVARVEWNDDGAGGTGNLVKGIEEWSDPGTGKKQSLVNLSAKGGRPLNNFSRMTRQPDIDSLAANAPSQAHNDEGDIAAISASRTRTGVDSEAVESRGVGAVIVRQEAPSSDIGSQASDVEDLDRIQVRRETAVINAAFLGPRASDGPKSFNKPIVVDVDLPVWT